MSSLPPDPGLLPDRLAEIREMLRLLWSCARQLRPDWRLAFVLNPPSANVPQRVVVDPLDEAPKSSGRASGRSTSRGELEVFVAHGIASIDQIGKALELTADQYRVLFAELAIPEAETLKILAGRSPFYAIWPHLPLADTTIAAVLGKTGAQVLGFRKHAIRHVAACMNAKMEAPVISAPGDRPQAGGGLR